MAEERESWRNPDEEEEDEEDDGDQTNYQHQKDAVLFAIDVSETMLAPPHSSDNKNVKSDSPTKAALKCALEIMKRRIFSNPSDMMGVLLFGTEKTKFEADETGLGVYPNCYLLCNLDIPQAEDVRTLKGVIDEDEEFQGLLTPSEKPVSMSSMLFCANQIFTTRAPDFGSRRLFIITDNDDPHGADKRARSGAQVKAKDLYDLGVVIELFPISHPNHEFDRTKFYDDIIYRDPAEGDSQFAASITNFKSSSEDGISLLNRLISDINSKQVAKRTLFSNLPFEIGPDFKISVKGYNLLQTQEPSRRCYVYTEGEKAKLVKGETKYSADDNAKGRVEKADITKAYKFGGTEISFTPQEMKEIRNFGAPVLRVIGFKPQSMLPIWASIKKSTFIFPSEEHFIGSTRVFVAFWKKLLKDKLMGLAWYIARANATPILVAILPGEEKLDEITNAQVMPAGLWLYPLPFADDLRPLPAIPKPPENPIELTVAMRKVVQQLQLPKATYDPMKYPNPSLQWFYRVIEALALEDEAPENPEDMTVPKFKQIHKRAGPYINDWRRLLDEQVVLWQREHGFTNDNKLKRESEDPESGLSRKKVKKEKLDLENLPHQELKNIVADDALKGYTIPELKKFLSAKNQNTSGKKPDLIERIEQWVEDN